MNLPFSMVGRPVHCWARRTGLCLEGQASFEVFAPVLVVIPWQKVESFLLGGGGGGFGVSFGFVFGGDELEMLRVELHLVQQQVLVKLEAWVAHLDILVLVVALDDAELTGRDGLPIPALVERGVFDHVDVAAPVSAEAVFDAGHVVFHVEVEGFGLGMCLQLP